MIYHSKSCTSLMKHLGGRWLCARSIWKLCRISRWSHTTKKVYQEENYAFFLETDFSPRTPWVLSFNSQQHQSSQRLCTILWIVYGHSTVIWTENIKNQNCLFPLISWQIENILVIVCENDKLCLLSVVVYA